MNLTDNFEKRVVSLLKEKQLVMTTAESCTGGLIAATVINVSGASSVIKEGYITYCDEAKHRLLGVSTDTLNKYTAVSFQVAQEMAQGGARAAKCDICISVTGVAGPDTEDGKPVGLVYLGLYYKGKVCARELHLSGSRQEIRQQAVKEALRFICDKVSE